MSLLVLPVMLAMLAGPRAARAEEADPDPRRVVAVLAFRAGAAELPEIDRRLAELLRGKTSLDVMDAVEARRRYGDRLDGDVVSCAGRVQHRAHRAQAGPGDVVSER